VGEVYYIVIGWDPHDGCRGGRLVAVFLAALYSPKRRRDGPEMCPSDCYLIASQDRGLGRVA